DHWNNCSCGEKMNLSAHSFSAWKTTKAATETTTGEKERVCSVCGYRETSVIAVLGHVHDEGSSEWNCDSVNHWNVCSCGERINVTQHTFGEWKTVKAATETAVGEKERVCSVCGYQESEVIAPLGTDTTNPDDTSKPDGTSKPIGNENDPENPTGFPWWILIVVIACVAIAVVVIIIIAKKKKLNTQNK
ncbi:MAG: hypothetical protein SPJ23_07800, partial [Eubacteriales bacterium]|nr:hypothetical protein [Eubacteriales bacterium]